MFFGLGYKIIPNWNIGADVQYNFGKITTTSLEGITVCSKLTAETNKSIYLVLILILEQCMKERFIKK